MLQGRKGCLDKALHIPVSSTFLCLQAKVKQSSTQEANHSNWNSQENTGLLGQAKDQGRKIKGEGPRPYRWGRWGSAAAGMVAR